MEQDHSPRIDVTILMPCLNEALTLPGCIRNALEALEMLAQRGLSGEILISDNGSDDGSRELAERAGCRVVRCARRGYGSALMHGSWEARGRFIVIADSDGSYDFREGVAMVEKLIEGNDLCMGSRFAGEIREGSMPWKNRYLGNPGLTSILNLFFQTGFTDAHCGLRAYTRSAFEMMRLTSPGMEFASEMLVKAALLNLKCAQIPVTLHRDGRDRPPHLRPWRDGWRHLKYLLLLSPTWLYLVPAALLMLVSVSIFGALLSVPSNQMFRLGPIMMGDHWMILAGGAFNLSTVAIIFAAIARVLSIERGYRRQSERFRRVLNLLTIERGIIAGLAFIAVGIIVIASITIGWYQSGYGALSRVREMVIGTVLVTVGLQAMFSAFLMTIVSDEREAARVDMPVSNSERTPAITAGSEVFAPSAALEEYVRA